MSGIPPPPPSQQAHNKNRLALAQPTEATHVILFVGNLSLEADEAYLQRLFSAYAQVVSVTISAIPELHALVTVSSYDDADVAIASLHLRYCMTQRTPVVVFYHKTSRFISTFGRLVWERYSAMMRFSNSSEEENTIRMLLMAEAAKPHGGDVAENGSTPPGLMNLPIAVPLDSFDVNKSRISPPPPPPDIRELGALFVAMQQHHHHNPSHRQNNNSNNQGSHNANQGNYLQNQNQNQQQQQQSNRGPQSQQQQGGGNQGTYQTGLSMIPGVSAPASGLPNRLQYPRGPTVSVGHINTNNAASAGYASPQQSGGYASNYGGGGGGMQHGGGYTSGQPNFQNNQNNAYTASTNAFNNANSNVGGAGGYQQVGGQQQQQYGQQRQNQNQPQQSNFTQQHAQVNQSGGYYGGNANPTVAFNHQNQPQNFQQQQQQRYGEVQQPYFQQQQQHQSPIPQQDGYNVYPQPNNSRINNNIQPVQPQRITSPVPAATFNTVASPNNQQQQQYSAQTSSVPRSSMHHQQQQHHQNSFGGGASGGGLDANNNNFNQQQQQQQQGGYSYTQPNQPPKQITSPPLGPTAASSTGARNPYALPAQQQQQQQGQSNGHLRHPSGGGGGQNLPISSNASSSGQPRTGSLGPQQAPSNFGSPNQKYTSSPYQGSSSAPPPPPPGAEGNTPGTIRHNPYSR